MRLLLSAAAAALLLTGVTAAPASAQTVKITPLGTHDGDMCRHDRALVFEDPDGTTLLFDAGRTVAGAQDPRLPKKLDVVLVSSVHGDHQGDRRQDKSGAGSCKSPKYTVKTTPDSNSVEIAAGKGSYILGAGQMRAYLSVRMVRAGVDKKKVKKLVKRLRPGGKMKFGGVIVSTIPTVHANGADAPFVIDKELQAAMKKSGFTAYAGPDSGFLLRFTNGLVVYISADTGHTSDMETLVRRYYKANLAVMNIGDINTMGPEEAAWATKELVKPASVIPSHANEQSTKGGKVIAGSKLETFIKDIGGALPVHPTISGQTMEFDGKGMCVKGC
jgi:L-ascorbate metabolism protein UlaG (beta-lactamase superfamily)